MPDSCLTFLKKGFYGENHGCLLPGPCSKSSILKLLFSSSTSNELSAYEPACGIEEHFARGRCISYFLKNKSIPANAWLMLGVLTHSEN
jgi:hypothetical protein